MASLLGPFLEWLGISHQQQFVYCVIAYIAGFIVYAIRARRQDLLLRAFYIVIGLAFFVFLFTESVRVRQSALVALVISVMAAFTCDYRRRHRNASTP